ncbi:MAG: DUF2188 domain-containing protein [Pseudonocardiaceae bacterium]
MSSTVTDGKWEARTPSADRAGAIVSTQAEGIDRARDILANFGVGESHECQKNLPHIASARRISPTRQATKEILAATHP